MSVSIATMGMFNQCCGSSTVGGGAPPYRQNADERVSPVIFVQKVEMVTINSAEDLFKNLHVRLKTEK